MIDLQYIAAVGLCFMALPTFFGILDVVVEDDPRAFVPPFVCVLACELAVITLVWAGRVVAKGPRVPAPTVQTLESSGGVK